MPLNLPIEIWLMLAGAGVLFLLPVALIYLAYRVLRGRQQPSTSTESD
jgi:hypothetical protein